MQGVLGINRKKPILHIEKNLDASQINVYIGLAFFESIPNDPKSFSYRYLVARLAKSGFSIASIARAFELDERTVKRYRDILSTSKNDQELLDRLVGLHCKKTKLTPEVKAFIRERFRAIYKVNRKDYNQKIRKEIEQKFDITLSPEALRRVSAPLRKEMDEQAGEQAPPIGTATVSESANPAPQIKQKNASSLREASEIDIFETQAIAPISRTGKEAGQALSPANNFFHTAGLLVLNLWIEKFVQSFSVNAFPLLQWLYQIFYGVVNFEQARYFPRREIEMFTGTKTVGTSQSRHHLLIMAYQDFDEYVQALFEANLHFVSLPVDGEKICYFYLDGHFDPYFGQLGILKGWCAVKNRTMKGTNHYILHDEHGHPVITELKDCFEDFRYTIKAMMPRVKSLVSHLPQMRVGLVYDRGGFSEEVCEGHEKTKTHFITWEKNFKLEGEKELDFKGTLTLYQEKNDVGTFREVVIEFLETTYRFSGGYECRKIIIKRQDDEKPMYASILTNDPISTPVSVITFLLQRWACQENDFKYQIAHFGLDEITSYASEMPDIHDKIQEEKGKLQAFGQRIEDFKQQRRKLLEPLGVKRLTKKKIEQIKDAASDGTSAELQIVQQYQETGSRLAHLRRRYTQKQKALKRMEKIDTNGYIRLDLRQKQIFDQLKIIARNIFYQALETFKEHYKNLRDLHVVFRKLTQAPGFVSMRGKEIHIHIEYAFTGQAEKAVTQFLEKLNAKMPKMLDGSGRSIRFNLHNTVANYKLGR
ncbi:MAG: hypothetical protein ACE5HS_23400 [bacterium]